MTITSCLTTLSSTSAVLGSSAGWYASVVFYDRDKLGGLSLSRFIEALQAEGVRNVHAGCNRPLHQSKLFYDVDIYGHGQPTARVNWRRKWWLTAEPSSIPGERPANRTLRPGCTWNSASLQKIQ